MTPQAAFQRRERLKDEATRRETRSQRPRRWSTRRWRLCPRRGPARRETSRWDGTGGEQVGAWSWFDAEKLPLPHLKPKCPMAEEAKEALQSIYQCNPRFSSVHPILQLLQVTFLKSLNDLLQAQARIIMIFRCFCSLP